jgi:ATP-dependent exoDNAse (exonuclease V) beta subunit
LRNLLAHYRCWLEPVNDLELRQTLALKLFIADRSHVWEIDHAQAAEWDELMKFVRVSVENVRREIVGAPPLSDDGSPPPVDAESAKARK